MFSFTYTAVSSTEIATTADVSADANSSRNSDVSDGPDVNISADKSEGIDTPTSTDAVTTPDVQDSNDAPGSVDVAKSTGASSSCATARPTTVMSTPTVPTTTAVVKKPTCPTTIAQDCSDIIDQGCTENYVIYRIQPSDKSESFEVVCDLKTNAQGWIVFQRRFEGSQNFYLPWEDDKNGFGSLTGEHWLGLEKLHSLTTNGVWQLRKDLEDFSGNTVYAEYSNFTIGDASTYYRLNIGEYSGNAGDSLEFHANMAFSTYDKDHDKW